MKKNVATINDQLRQIMMTQKRALAASLNQNLGLTPQQTRVLGVIEKRPGIIQRALADEFHLRSASVSNMVKILERDGYILRKVPTNSGRSKQIFITEKGSQAIAGFPSYFDATQNRMVDGMSETEQLQLIALLNKLLAAYGETSI